MSDANETIDRREFLSKSAALIAGGAALPSTALSTAFHWRILEREAVEVIWTGSRRN